MKPTPLPGARRPSLAWRLAYARLVAARILVRITRAHVQQLALAAFVVLLVTSWRTAPEQPPQVSGAWIMWVIQIGVMLVAGLIAAAMRPKPKPPEKVKANIPVVEDGKGIVDFFGTVWVDDPLVAAHKDKGTKKIKAKGGGKK